MLGKIPWWVGFIVASLLLIGFSSYPFARYIFLPLSCLIGVAAYFCPAFGIGLFTLSTLTTLQVPILLGFPYFSGPEPFFFALAGAVFLRFALSRVGRLELSPVVSFTLLVFTLTILASAFSIWFSYKELPFFWLSAITKDALSKIYFWRWENPLNFLRMALLYLEGIAALLVVVAACRLDGVRLVRRSFVLSLFVSGILLMGYSALDLLVRGKEITTYPGFGPVFTDRNAFAGFWVLYAPIAVSLSLSSKGLFKAIAAVAALGAFLFCCLSLSMTGIAVIAISTPLVFALIKARDLRNSELRRRLRWYLGSLAAVALIVTLWSIPADIMPIGSMLKERLVPIQKRGLLGILFDDRGAPWLVSWEIFKDHPFIGAGPGEVYRLFSEYSTQLGELPHFEYAQENAHNYFIQLLAGTGIFGWGFFTFLIAIVLCGGIRRLLRSPIHDGQTDHKTLGESERSCCSPKVIKSFIGRLLGLNGNLDCTEDQRFKISAGLVSGLAGISLFSITQHPMLRFEFQVYFWIVAGLLVASVFRSRESHAPIRRWGWIAAALVLGGTLLQATLFPRAPLGEFEYGFRPPGLIDGTYARQTEQLAFIRTKDLTRLRPPKGTEDIRTESPNQLEKINLLLRGSLRSQRARLELNGEKIELNLSESEWKKMPTGKTDIDGNFVEFGIISSPIRPERFRESWGGGAYITVEPLDKD